MNLALVTRVDLRQAVLLTSEGEEVVARLRARLMDRNKRVRGAVVSGDEVEWEGDDGSPVVENVLPRKNYFARRAGSGEAREQVVAANLDAVLLVIALAEPPFHPGLLDRVAVAAHHADIPLHVVFTKVDLVPARVVDEAVSFYTGLGYPVHAVSSLESRGVTELRASISERRVLFAGHSGVGKSTLLNALQPSLGLRINEVNPVTGRGRHTTTAALLVRLDDGTEVVDTPGFRSFSPWGMEPDEIAAAFPEMREQLGGCGFRDCAHRSEPKCAIKAAVEAGKVRQQRYDSYVRMYDEAEELTE